ncbi:hypothetical protein B0A55_02986 [Friedmanniomyces simplex]|uniref:Uncharacterized protein n=1 Tax=Friedmanniomyces simplex TaxID=329884 RepID=A0A4U0XUY0_9PEZI|nr:hypothetical protein B0A55_02986 [Friedmanniomyces simplex]
MDDDIAKETATMPGTMERDADGHVLGGTTHVDEADTDGSTDMCISESDSEVEDEMPLLPSDGPPVDVTNVQRGYLDYRHSYPGALLSYGPQPAPVIMPQHPVESSGTGTASVSPHIPSAPVNSPVTDYCPSAPVNSPATDYSPSGVPEQDYSYQQALIYPDHHHQPYSYSSYTNDPAHPAVHDPRPAPTLAMHAFVHCFTSFFRAYQPALITFATLTSQYNAGVIDSGHFYVSVYQLLYRTQALELMQEFCQFAPKHWLGKDLGWFHRAIEQKFDDDLWAQARVRAMLMGEDMGEVTEAMAGSTTDNAEEGDDGAAGPAMETGLPESAAEHQLPEAEVSGTQQIVTLKVGRAPLQILAHKGVCVLNAKKGKEKDAVTPKPKLKSRRVSTYDQGGRLLPLSRATSPQSVLKRKRAAALRMNVLRPTKKKVPVNGFRASGGKTVSGNGRMGREGRDVGHEMGLSDGADGDGPQSKNDEIRRGEAMEQQAMELESSSSLTESESSPAGAANDEVDSYEDETGAIASAAEDARARGEPSPSKGAPALTLSGKEIETETFDLAEPDTQAETETEDGLESDPEYKEQMANPRATSHAADHEYVGPIYLTRRAILARIEKPYIHLACEQGFPHPQDVRGHHTKCFVTRKRKGKAAPKDVPEWDAHESCKIGYTELMYTKVLEGYVVLDQASVDRIEKAVKTGVAFLKAKKEKIEAEGGGEVETRVWKGIVRKGRGKRKAKRSYSAEDETGDDGDGESMRPPPPKRQYVRAGPD